MIHDSAVEIWEEIWEDRCTVPLCSNLYWCLELAQMEVHAAHHGYLTCF